MGINAQPYIQGLKMNCTDGENNIIKPSCVP